MTGASHIETGTRGDDFRGSRYFYFGFYYFTTVRPGRGGLEHT